MTERARQERVGEHLPRHVVEGAGIPALVIGSSIYYPRTFSARLRSSLRMAFLDLPHFSPPRAPDAAAVTIETYIDDIEHVRAALGMERIVMIGHSHHGNVGLEYATRHPDKVSHLVLIGTPPCDVQTTLEAGIAYWAQHASDTRERALRANRIALAARSGAAMTAAQAFVADYVADGPRYWNDLHYDASSLWHGVPIDMGLLGNFRSFFTDYRLDWDPDRMTAPVLVITGRHDYAVPHVLWDAVLPRLENVHYRMFERSGHTPQLEEPERFDATLLEWLGVA